MGWQDWLSIVLGIIGLAAFVMAIPPFIAMIWGGPKLYSMLSLESNSSGAILMYTIWNDPVTKGVLHTLRIRRATAEDVWVSFRIIEEPSGKQVFSAMPVINTATGLAARRVSLPPSTLGGHFGIAIADANGKVYPGLEIGRTEPLHVDSYRVEVDVHLEGKEISHVQKRFIVRDREPFVYLTN